MLTPSLSDPSPYGNTESRFLGLFKNTPKRTPFILIDFAVPQRKPKKKVQFSHINCAVIGEDSNRRIGELKVARPLGF